MEADRSCGGAGATNPSPGGSGAGRNPNGPKAAASPSPSNAGAMAASSQPKDMQEAEAGLSLPGILHFIQHEWGRFQAEKYRWEAERDELRVGQSEQQPRRCDFGRRWSVHCCVSSDGRAPCRSARSASLLNNIVTSRHMKGLAKSGRCSPRSCVVTLSPSSCARVRDLGVSWHPENGAQVAFLQNERKGQENMKQDLVRRIKMLEYALKQERAKHQKLKAGSEQNPGEKKQETGESEQVSNGPADSDSAPANQMSWKEGRQLLRNTSSLCCICFRKPSASVTYKCAKRYLEEVGYSDTILDMRSKRVRSLLGRSSPEVNGPPDVGPSPPLAEREPRSGGESLLVKQIEEQIKRNAGKESSKERLSGSVLEKLPFLHGCEEEEEDDSDEDDDFQGMATDSIDGPRKHKKSRVKRKMHYFTTHAGVEIKFLGAEPVGAELDPDDEEDEDDSEDALGEFDFLGSGEEGEGAGEARISGDGQNRRNKLQGMMSDLRDVDGLPPKSAIPSSVPGQSRGSEGGALGFSSDVFILDTVGGGDMNLGELADLTVDNDLTIDLQDSREEFKKTWNPRFTLRSHFDAIRGLTFHPSQAVLLSASEDGTLKLWNLHKAIHSKKNTALDVEPIYTFRAHSGAVLSMAMDDSGESCYSGGLDGTVRCWKIPDLNVDPYDNYDPRIESSVLAGHTDAVWWLAYSPAQRCLASCSADGTVRIWDPSQSATCVSVFSTDKDLGIPTSVAFVNSDPSQTVVSYNGGDTLIYDLSTEQRILTLESKSKEGCGLINRVVSHPSLAVSITAHENRSIRFLDNKTGKVIHSMVAHLDAVTCLATDPKGTYLISGSHDCSVRLWTLDSRTCVQEITAHRKKHDEAIHDVAFHPSQPFIASAGADALAKIFV
ncbi:STRN4 protein, partial [Atractosteus spatula]|nr:STRN4 protein [Atractosteus spatula]